MANVVILTEKPSAAKNFAKALGGMSGSFEGTDYKIVHALGHLLEFKQPVDQVAPDKVEKYKSWELGSLPWDPKDFTWERELRKKGKTVDSGAKSLLADLGRDFNAAQEISIAADLDPTGEGDLLAWEVIDYLGLHHKTFTRMEFLDETEASIQKAFRNRRSVKSMEDEGGYRKAQFRSQWDMLSMQFTRVSTKASGSQVVLRNGRLKSAMVVLVGDALEAHNNYVKKPFFENRFKDENGVVYTDPETDRFEDKAQVPGGLNSSPVVKDGVSRKKTAPPKLMDLAGLSALLSKRGFSAKKVLENYQLLYQAQVVSYPRTEDRFISSEQFKELLPKVDQIAKVVGVDPAALTVRTERKTHIKSGGAHGANRPGPNVPPSLDAVEKTYGALGRAIYETLARNYLTMLAPDYEYDQHKGHVQDYPSYVGTLSVPAVQGWKGIFDLDAATAEDDDEAEEGSGATSLGTMADPFVHEGYPPRPPHPSMTWLMKQLERRSVGTGATRTSTYAEVTNNAAGKALMVEGKGGKLTLSNPGELNYHIVAGTNIGDLGLTERVFDQMKQVETAGADPAAFLAEVAELVRADIVTMGANAKKLPKVLTDKLNKAGVYKQPVEVIELPPSLHYTALGKTITKAKRTWSGHRFTDDEVAKLVAGETIAFTATSAKTGNEFPVKGKLEGQIFEKNGEKSPFVGFAPQFEEKEKAEGQYKGEKFVKFNAVFSGHRFTREEIAKLLDGETIEFKATSAKSGKEYTAKGKLGDGKYGFGFQLDTSGFGKGSSKGGSARGSRGGRR